MFCAKTVEITFTYLHIFNFLLLIYTFSIILQNSNQTGLWVIYLYIEYRIKTRRSRLIRDINKLDLYFRFQYFILKLDTSMCTSPIIRIKSIIMIDIHKNVIRRTSLRKQKCKQRNPFGNGADLIFIRKITNFRNIDCLISALENWLISTYFICFSIRVRKKCWDTLCATFKKASNWKASQHF